jgi:hypothetical protein
MSGTQLSNSKLKVLVKDLQSAGSVQANYTVLEDRAQQTEFLHVGYQYPMSLQTDPLFSSNVVTLLQILNHVKSEPSASVSFKVYFTMMIRYSGTEVLTGAPVNLVDASGEKLEIAPVQPSHEPGYWGCECFACQNDLVDSTPEVWPSTTSIDDPSIDP